MAMPWPNRIGDIELTTSDLIRREAGRSAHPGTVDSAARVDTVAVAAQR